MTSPSEPTPQARPGSTAPTPDALVVLCTAPSEAVGRQLATTLVEERLAACVNLLPGVTSIYRWEGRVEEAGEVLLLLKLSRAGYPELERRLLELHPYDTPEVLALGAEAVEARYQAWLQSP